MGVCLQRIWGSHPAEVPLAARRAYGRIASVALEETFRRGVPKSQGRSTLQVSNAPARPAVHLGRGGSELSHGLYLLFAGFATKRAGIVGTGGRDEGATI